MNIAYLRSIFRDKRSTFSSVLLAGTICAFCTLTCVMIWPQPIKVFLLSILFHRSH
uniref:Uncharacterized protein n=1 Tax=Rhizophora mucronata TaxID=61149 RepID=A0A2P2LD28_RHIMU